ncbi:zinc/cadmium resistance protein isoform X1 [Thrips palmi]|uniref:Zinc/cadmium resistance protein isoform X1 n=1 Tax=Thrips palmi TaxID=161013 RepID=A0A6P8ZCE6_THRPL|nr:zinc/cadmium resistance protein isoform X1 [Thrips palmi]XP_034246284.1 zinc/cadmium resistance protein isoform X1 [Thrips palmi]
MGRYTGKKCRLISMFWLTTFFFLVEIVVGYVTNSMALVADSFHMLSDVAALVVAFLSVKMSPKKWSKNTFGWARAEVLGALVNAVFLVALCFSITVEACKRFIEVEEIHEPRLIVVVGVLGLLVNLIGLCLFHEHGHGGHGHSHGGISHGGIGRSHTRLTQLVSTDDNENDETFNPPLGPALAAAISNNKGHSDQPSEPSASQMNMRGVFLHVMADALGSVIVIVSASVVWLTDWEYKLYMDPALSIVMVILILRAVWPLLQESALILLQTVPTHIQVDAIQRRLLDKVDGVLAVHEFHVWQLAGDRIIASAHIRVRNLSEYMKIAEKVKEFFHNEGIHSTTIQPEFIEIGDFAEDTVQPGPTEDCVLDCPKTDKPCALSTCCGPSKHGSPRLHPQTGGRDSPSPGDTPYLCRQRNNSSTNFNNRGEEVNQMERGALLIHMPRGMAPTVSAESTGTLSSAPPPFPGTPPAQFSQTPNGSCKCPSNPPSPVIVKDEVKIDTVVV